MTHRRHKRDRRKPERVERAKARQAACAEQTPDDRLLILQARGHGHCTEAQRIAKMLQGNS